MPRGPGRVEKAIAVAFSLTPSHRFTVRYLVGVCYPGTQAIKPQHRIVVRAAALRAAARLG
jgi:hypothetical protein